jgi:DNA mismatch repair protein MutS
MADHRDELTPMLRQYFDLCERYDDSLLLFQVGDFYEAFCEAAEETARICEITLTKREDSTGTYPMAGIPVDNAAKYLERLLDAGYRVAVADQVEDAAEASGLVDRAVTRVVTPGTIVDDELLRADTSTYVAAAVADRAASTGTRAKSAETYALAAVDVSTGECLVTSTDSRERLVEELDRVAPAELVSHPDSPVSAAEIEASPMETAYDPAVFDAVAARERVGAYVPRPEAVLANDAELRACGGVLAYAEYTQGDAGPLEYVSRIRRYDPREHLRLDATAQRSLELFDARGSAAGETLMDVLDDTSCALGRRLLASWLRRPLVDRAAIEARLDSVEELADSPFVREELSDRLREVYDVERLIGRVSRGRANARDLRALKATLDVVPDAKSALADADAERLRDLRAALDELADVRDLIGRAIDPDPPIEVTEGGVIREGFDDELDSLRETVRAGREWVADLEANERERTEIDSLSVGHNQVHGYYIEVTNPNLDRVPDDYTRRQTLKNSERFYTPELKRREDEIFGAAERADSLEYELFREVREDVAAEADRVQSLASALAELDVLTALAGVAVANDYVRPEFRDAGIDVRAGRHPVVERTQEAFVPNDALLADSDGEGPDGSASNGRVAVITGPNMSGKSTYMRQIALVCALAQIGSFVPADAARLPVLDRIFTRVGASDDIAGGQSTFMREMTELTEILHGATENSLVLLDEVGRGTSTTDGLAIAWATTEFIRDEIGAYTLFATHYHELTALADERPGVFNLHFTVDSAGSPAGGDGDGQGGGADGSGTAAAGDEPRVTFLHRVAAGSSSSSYGVEVARMAGVPDAGGGGSRELVRDGVPSGGTAAVDDAAGESAERATPSSVALGESGIRGGDVARSNGRDGGGATELDGDVDALADEGEGGTDDSAALRAVAEELRSLEIASTTPLEALNALDRLKRRLDDDQ